MRTLALALVLVPLAAGCASYRSWSFGPSPQDHEIAVGTPDLVVARIQVAALGLEDAPDSGDPPRVELRFRLRVANESAADIELASEAFELVDGDLCAFGAATVAPESGGLDLTVAFREARRFDVAFPLPDGSAPGDLDLSGLSLTFGVIHEGRLRVASARFERLQPGSRYDPAWHVGVGFGFVH